MTKKLQILQKILRLTAVGALKKYNPRIIGVTGSVGKTSAKEAIFTVLAGHFRVRRNEKNYNNEIGIPLTIIGASSGGSSIFGWCKVFFKWIAIMLLPFEYPEVLVLEMGADRPGDLKYLTDFIKLEVGVITDISASHLEFFKSLEGVAKEKGTVIRTLDEKGMAVLNVDNQNITVLEDQAKSSLITVGFSKGAEMQATDPAFVYAGETEPEIKGMSFKLNYRGTSIPVRLNNILARHQIYPALFAAAIGTWFGLNLVEIGAALENFYPPCGRMNLIPGIKNTSIIDDTYNASPASALAALETLGEISAPRKIAVLGDMLELGGETESGHRKIARKFLEIKGDIIFLVGKRMQFAAQELAKNNFEKSNIFNFSDPIQAGRKLQEIIRESDLILIKGSQGMRMEKIVEEIMVHPQKAPELLCRQNSQWKEKPFREV
jgi:UDP-N-acetylmuramoyl-tripeptide--D-alanyl-D-alanine ligase